MEQQVVSQAMEGGLTTEEYLALYEPDLGKVVEVLSLAMAIEAQALDLYLRAAEETGEQQIRSLLHTIAEEERKHISHLAKLIEQHVE